MNEIGGIIVMDDLVEIECYGTKREMKREEAIREFFNGVACCEGSERDRYLSVLLGLQKGLMKVDDEWAWTA